MNKTIFFNDEMNFETVGRLIETLEIINDMNVNEFIPETVNIYFCTNGGIISSADVLIDYINNYSIPITIILYEECSSAGFHFALNVDVDVKVLNTTFSALHRSAVSLSSRKLKDRTSIDHFFNEHGAEIDERMISDFKKAGLTDEQLRLINEGKDIFLNSDQILKAIMNFRENKLIDELNEDITEAQFEIDSMISLREELLAKHSKNKDSKKKNKKWKNKKAGV